MLAAFAFVLGCLLTALCFAAVLASRHASHQQADNLLRAAAVGRAHPDLLRQLLGSTAPALFLPEFACWPDVHSCEWLNEVRSSCQGGSGASMPGCRTVKSGTPLPCSLYTAHVRACRLPHNQTSQQLPATCSIQVVAQLWPHTDQAACKLAMKDGFLEKAGHLRWQPHGGMKTCHAVAPSLPASLMSPGVKTRPSSSSVLLQLMNSTQFWRPGFLANTTVKVRPGAARHSAAESATCLSTAALCRCTVLC